MNALIVVLLCAIVIMLIVILYKLNVRDQIFPGDIVLYNDPMHAEGRNMITMVLNVNHRHGTVQIRSEKTTTMVKRSCLQVLKVDRAFPILVPTIPTAECSIRRGPEGGPKKFRTVQLGERLPAECDGVASAINQAIFSSVALDWFGYRIEVDDELRCLVA